MLIFLCPSLGTLTSDCSCHNPFVAWISGLPVRRCFPELSHEAIPTAEHIKTFTLLQNPSLLRNNVSNQSQNCSVQSGIMDAMKQKPNSQNIMSTFLSFYLLFEFNSLTTIFFFCFDQGHLDPSSEASRKLPAGV